MAQARLAAVWLILAIPGVVLGAVACAPSPAGGASPTEKSADAPQPRPVKVARPRPETLQQGYPSNLYVERDVRVRARRSGNIERILVDRGSRVRAGQILAVLDSDLAADDLAMAEQELRMAEADYESRRALHEQKVISAHEFLRAETARDVAKTRTDLARERLERCNVRAPFDGVVVERWARLGQRVQEDEDTALFRILGHDPLRARVDVPEERLPGLAVGAAARVEVTGDAGSHAGRVVFISPAVDPASGTTPVIVELSSSARSLRPGASVRVRLDASPAPEALRIPRRALRPEAPGGTDAASILVAERGRVAPRRVRVLERRGDTILVAGGITAEDRVIVDPAGGLEPGDAVVAEEEVP